MNKQIAKQIPQQMQILGDLIAPGEILAEEFLKPLKISQQQLAQDIDVPKSRISRIVSGQCAITADTAVRFAKFFGNNAQFWLNMQNYYDLQKIERKQAQ